MGSATVKVDEKGRIIIPKGIRKITNLKEGSCLAIKAEGKKAVIEPIEPVADKYFGAFKIAKWPEDIDDSRSRLPKNGGPTNLHRRKHFRLMAWKPPEIRGNIP